MVPDIVAMRPLSSVGRQFDAAAVLAVAEVASPSTRRTHRVPRPSVDLWWRRSSRTGDAATARGTW